MAFRENEAQHLPIQESQGKTTNKRRFENQKRKTNVQ